MATETAPTLADVEAARERLDGKGVRITPVYSSETFRRLTGRAVHLKAENLQRTGSFKIRGAVNKIEALDQASEGRRRHGERREPRPGGRLGGSRGGIESTVFMPAETPMAKVEPTRNYGAHVELAGRAFEEALEAALERAEATGATFVHAFEDPVVIAGQGTIGLEIAEQVPTSRRSSSRRRRRPGVRRRARSARCTAGRQDRRRPGGGVRTARRRGDLGYTIAEGIAVKHPGELTSVLVEDLLDDVVTVTDEEISEAIVLLLERVKLVVEGAGAASVAALLAGKEGSGSALAILRRQHRPDAPHPGHAPWTDARGAVSRRSHAHSRPAGGADQAPVDVRG